jgi:heat shock protein beta
VDCHSPEVFDEALSDIFLRELISNSNDALEKLRLTALKDKSLWDGSTPLNITIRAVKNEDGTGGQLIITGQRHAFVPQKLINKFLDTGIGMTPEELTTNLVTTF